MRQFWPALQVKFNRLWFHENFVVHPMLRGSVLSTSRDEHRAGAGPARSHGELTDAVARELGLTEVKTDGGYVVKDLESCDAALTECEALVAQTGSVLVSVPSAGGRALSVLPPHHVVLARRSQMVSDLTAVLQQAQEKFKGQFPSFLSFISGPSRTGDIERILVLGAHGPKKLTILLLP